MSGDGPNPGLGPDHVFGRRDQFLGQPAVRNDNAPDHRSTPTLAYDHAVSKHRCSEARMARLGRLLANVAVSNFGAMAGLAQ